jgi:hypothetical protein
MPTFNPYEHGARSLQSLNDGFNPLEHGARIIQKPKEPIQEPEGDPWPALLGKSATKGLTDIAGLFGNFQTPQQATPETQKIIDKYKNRLTSQEKQMLDSRMPNSADITGYLNEKSGYDLTPRPQGPAQRIASNAVEFGTSSLLPFGKFNGLAQLGKQGAVGAGVGAVSSTAQEMGFDPLMADIGASVATPYGLSAIKNAPQTLAKAPRALMGLSPSKINLDAALAARELGIDLPAAALTDSKLVGLADQLAGKVPFLGTNKLKTKYDKAQEQTKKALENIYDSIGPKKTEEVQKKIDSLYSQRIKELPKNAAVRPNHTIEALNKININSISPSNNEKTLLNIVDTYKNELTPVIKSKFGDVNVPVQETSVQRLADSKRSLNALIKWDVDEGVKNQARLIQKGLSKDIAEYGKTNPEWYKTFKDADGLFGKVAKREKITNALEAKATNYATDDLSYNALAKSIRDPNKASVLKKQTSPEIMNKINKLGTVAKAMSAKARDIPNPSGTAITHSSLAVIGGLFTAPISTISTLLGGQVASELLTNKKFLDAAIDAASKPNNTIKAMAFSKRLKDITGYSAIALSRELARTQNIELQSQYPDAITINNMGGE